MLQSYETCCLFQVLNRLEPAPSAVSGANFLLSLPLSSGEKSKRCRPKLRNSRASVGQRTANKKGETGFAVVGIDSQDDWFPAVVTQMPGESGSVARAGGYWK